MELYSDYIFRLAEQPWKVPHRLAFHGWNSSANTGVDEPGQWISGCFIAWSVDDRRESAGTSSPILMVQFDSILVCFRGVTGVSGQEGCAYRCTHVMGPILGKKLQISL